MLTTADDPGTRPDKTTQCTARQTTQCAARQVRGHFLLPLLMALPDRSPIASPKICNSRCRAGHATGRGSVRLQKPPEGRKSMRFRLVIKSV